MLEKIYNPLHELDITLKALDETKGYPNSGSVNYIVDVLRKDYEEVEFHKVYRIFEYLVQDGYLIRRDELGYSNIYDKIYEITFEGEYFLFLGGYTQKQRDIESERNKQDQLTERIKKNEERLVAFNKWVAIGGGGILFMEIIKFIWELYKYYYPTLPS